MNELLDQIEARHAEISKHAGLGKSQRRMLDAMFESAKDVPRLLAAVRAVDAVQGAEPTSDQWNIGYNDALEDVHHALTEALEGER